MEKERKIDRFDKYMVSKNLNDNKVTINLGLSVGTLGKSRKEGRDLSGKNIEKILNFYTDLNKIWLLTGEGNMLKIIPSIVEDSVVQYEKNDNTSRLIRSIDKLTEVAETNSRTIDKMADNVNKLIDLLEKGGQNPDILEHDEQAPEQADAI